MLDDGVDLYLQSVVLDAQAGVLDRGNQMDREKLKKSLKLDDKTAIHLNHPIGYTANGK